MNSGGLLGNPLKVRRGAYIAAVAFIVLNILTYGTSLQLFFALTWLFVPIIALAIGYGDAFFIEHGRGFRRAIAQLILTWTVGLATCSLLVVLNTDSTSALQRVVQSVLYGLVYGSALFFLAALIGLGAGRGIGYSTRKIAKIDEDDW